MMNFPFVWLVSVLTIIAAFALVQNTRVPFNSRLFLSIFLVSLAVIGVLLGLRLSYEVPWVGQIQPYIALLIAPSAYLGFQALREDPARPLHKTLLVHALPIVFIQVLMASGVPVSADFFVLGITGIYLTLTTTLLRSDTDDFVYVAPTAVPMLRFALYAATVLLGLMVATDVLIVSASLFAGDAFVLQFLTGASGVFTAFVFVAALVGAPMLLKSTMVEGAITPTQMEPSVENKQLFSDIEKFMRDNQFYKDSNLTLSRVARRLNVPTRNVSNAVNKCTKSNFSRYINALRITHAKKLLIDTDLSITEIMFESGFISKSSFNAEFNRIVGRTPSQFRDDQPLD